MLLSAISLFGDSFSLFFSLFKIYFIFISVYEFLSAYMYEYHVCTVPVEAKRSH